MLFRIIKKVELVINLTGFLVCAEHRNIKVSVYVYVARKTRSRIRSQISFKVGIDNDNSS